MGKIKDIMPVKLFCGFIYGGGNDFEKAKEACAEAFGKGDYESPATPFTHTDYYEKEFGKNLLRRFLSFEKLVFPDALADIKHQTNAVERELSKNGKRRVNIDPGYLTLSKVVLATTKDYMHRIYIGHGMYAEVTLYFKDNMFQGFPWTYPDYKTPEYVEIFNKIREIYKKQVNALTG